MDPIAELLERARLAKQQVRFSAHGYCPYCDDGTCASCVQKMNPVCPKCRDLGYLLPERPAERARECPCQEEKRLRKWMDRAMLPESFRHMEISEFTTKREYHAQMKRMAEEYLQRFGEKPYSFGLIARVGEAELKRIANPVLRAEKSEQHNSYGLGKTTLVVAMGRELIRRGYSVLMISDVPFLKRVLQDQISDKAAFERLMKVAKEADVLVWDDLGKPRESDAKKEIYYEVINTRYMRGRPILYTSNESGHTLEEKIGMDSLSRLVEMSGPYLLELEGVNERLQRGG